MELCLPHRTRPIRCPSLHNPFLYLGRQNFYPDLYPIERCGSLRIFHFVAPTVCPLLHELSIVVQRLHRHPGFISFFIPFARYAPSPMLQNLRLYLRHDSRPDSNASPQCLLFPYRQYQQLFGKSDCRSLGDHAIIQLRHPPPVTLVHQPIFSSCLRMALSYLD